MRVNYLWTSKEIVVTLDETEATRITAFVAHHLVLTSDPDSDVPTQLEDALSEILT